MQSSSQNGPDNPHDIPGPHEILGRYLTDSFGQPILTEMEKRYWDYFDWMCATGTNMHEVSMKLDLVRKDYTMGEMLTMAIHICSTRVEEAGLDRPAHLHQL